MDKDADAYALMVFLITLAHTIVAPQMYTSEFEYSCGALTIIFSCGLNGVYIEKGIVEVIL